jgi:hypothetical protein
MLRRERDRGAQHEISIAKAGVVPNRSREQSSDGWTDGSSGTTNALDGPVGITPVARRHVLGRGGVPMVAAAAPMRRDPLALRKDLDGLRREPHLDPVAHEAVRDAVKMSVDLDMVIDTDAAHAPFGKAIGLGGQPLEVGPIEFFEQGAAGDAEPADRALFVELSPSSTIAALSSARL